MFILIGLLVVIAGSLTTVQSGFNGALNKEVAQEICTGALSGVSA